MFDAEYQTWRKTRQITGKTTLFGFLILASVGLLTTLSPARGVQDAQQSQRLVLRQPAGTLQATLAISPPRIGPAQYEVTLRNQDGTPYDIARRVRLRFSSPGSDLGVGDTLAQAQGDGRYTVEGAFITLPGTWQVELQVQRPDAFDAFTAFDLAVGADGIRQLHPDTGPDPTGLLVWGFLATGVGLVLFGFWLRLQRPHFAVAPLVLVAGVGFLIVTALRFYDPLAPMAAAARGENPIAPTESSLARGAQVYEEHCMRCHGEDGFGNGPDAASLGRPPADLHVHVAHHPDEELFRIITDGFPELWMPAFGNVLSTQDRWHLINYLHQMTGS